MFPSGLDEDTYKAAHRENRPTTILLQLSCGRFSKFQSQELKTHKSSQRQSHQMQRLHPSSQKSFPGPHQFSFSNHSNWQLRKTPACHPSLACKHLTSFISLESKNIRNHVIIIPFLVAGMKYLKSMVWKKGFACAYG